MLALLSPTTSACERKRLLGQETKLAKRGHSVGPDELPLVTYQKQCQHIAKRTSDGVLSDIFGDNAHAKREFAKSLSHFKVSYDGKKSAKKKAGGARTKRMMKKMFAGVGADPASSITKMPEGS